MGWEPCAASTLSLGEQEVVLDSHSFTDIGKGSATSGKAESPRLLDEINRCRQCLGVGGVVVVVGAAPENFATKGIVSTQRVIVEAELPGQRVGQRGGPTRLE